MRWPHYYYLVLAATASALRPFTIEDLVSLDRPSAAIPSPNGHWAVLSKAQYSIEESKFYKNLVLISLITGKVLPLTTPNTYGDREPIWLDSTTVGFISDRSNSSQLWSISIDLRSEPVQVTEFPVGIANIKYNTEMSLLTFTSSVYEDGSLEEAARLDNEKSNRFDSALVYDELFVRHWDHFVQSKKTQIFSARLERRRNAFNLSSRPVNIMQETPLQSPVDPFGGPQDYDVSPDGKEVAFLAKKPGRDQAWETDTKIYIAPISGDKKPITITESNRGACSSPVYSPSGRYLAWLQMETPKYESDRRRVVLYDRSSGERRYLVEDWDRSPSALSWSKDSKVLYAISEDEGKAKLFSINVRRNGLSQLSQDHYAWGLKPFRGYYGHMLVMQNSFTYPSEVYTISPRSGRLEQHTDFHKSKLKDVFMSKPEEFWFEGSYGDKVHGFIFKPINFDPSQKYPLAFLIHGGPQGAWTDGFNFLWNPQIYASAGYVVVAINPRGSTGYGQKFTDQINRNWGGAPYRDLMMGLDFVLDEYDFIDGSRMCALGASYGGYMINWLNGHTKRFNCLVNHDGVFDTIDLYYSTEELYFPEFDFGGTPWDPVAKQVYKHWSPAKFVSRWTTPTLVIHGGKDYRIVDGAGLSTFTALQRQGVPSRLVYFPDENHWTLKPGNSIRWHHEVLGWLNKYTSVKDQAIFQSQEEAFQSWNVFQEDQVTTEAPYNSTLGWDDESMSPWMM
ncbi:peptidase, S9C subfamily [Basidiobolus meristosporus CBS 931.73]|uniref:Dipeptidyl-peptidase V n=1 Tax=Basidiobolus meristosporus CBS 931.73 TaxID=1314790 RepID=A0A1Y1Y275_9FUNG|nr:peptidase, S9C subfamily [Basidiobolus meristosporus CBS 931.73]|eukprot:ORX91724.1 peptidase, S9C subfamily [Basidiobolus meristosporus CBS 931.73]